MYAPGNKYNQISEFLKYRKDPIGFFKKNLSEYGELVHLKLMGKNIFLVANPEDAEYVLQKNSKNYLKGRSTKKTSEILGNGLITSDGKDWKKQNQLIRKSFSVKNIRNLAPTFLKHANNFKSHLKHDETINMHEFLHKLSLEIVMDSLFNLDINDFNTEIYKDIKNFLEHIVVITRSIVRIPDFIPTTYNRKIRKSKNNINKLIEDIIKSRIELINRGDDAPNDLLSFLVNHENLGQMNHKQLRDEIITLFMAGHETIANTISWTFILLCKNPSYFEELKALANEVFNDDGLDLEILEGDNIARSIICESMRLHPTVWVFTREAIEDDVIRGHKVPKGSMMVLTPYFTHKSEKYWERPMTFEPNRFKGIKNINANSPGVKYYPFGYGPRMCIGNHMALIEAQIILLSFCRDFYFKIKNEEEIKENPGFTLSPLNNYDLKVYKY